MCVGTHVKPVAKNGFFSNLNVTPDGRTIVALSSSMTAPAEVYTINIGTNTVANLSRVNPVLVNDEEISGSVRLKEGDRVTQIYLVRPLDEVPHLQCLYRPEEGESELIDYGALPLNLAIDERAWSFLSPDERTLYVACSDPDRAIWLAYALDSRGDVAGRRIFARNDKEMVCVSLAAEEDKS